VKLLSDVERDYLAEVRGVLREQTIQDKERHFAAFRTWLKADPEMKQVTRRQAGDYVGYLAKQDFARKTKEYIVSQMSSLWKWAVVRGHVELNIWRDQTSTLARSKRGGEDDTARRAFTEPELLQLLDPERTDLGDPIWAVSALALYTGLRLEEACQMPPGTAQRTASR
jgi:site-specific recombinase XerD